MFCFCSLEHLPTLTIKVISMKLKSWIREVSEFKAKIQVQSFNMSWNKFPVQEDVADYASVAPAKAPQSASCAREYGMWPALLSSKYAF